MLPLNLNLRKVKLGASDHRLVAGGGGCPLEREVRGEGAGRCAGRMDQLADAGVATGMQTKQTKARKLARWLNKGGIRST
jgi:hypothetical protein